MNEPRTSAREISVEEFDEMIENHVIDQVLNPGEAPLPSASVVRSVEVKYPPASMSLFGWHIHWLIVYFILSIAFGFAFKGVFKVEI